LNVKAEAMLGDSAEFEIVVLSVSAIFVILYGLLLLARLRHDGDLGKIFAKAVVDGRTCNTILVGIGIISSMFILTGILSVAEDIGFVTDDVQNILNSGIFLTGAGTLLYLTRTGFALSNLTLEEELDLRDSHPEVFQSLTSSDKSDYRGSSSVYTVSAVEQVHRFDEQFPEFPIREPDRVRTLGGVRLW
jgi:hypothetical protein